MNKKVGLLNFQFSTYNYGAVLQAAALERVVRELGYDVEHINLISEYRPPFKHRVKLAMRKAFEGTRNFVINNKKELTSIFDVGNNKVFEIFRKKWITRTATKFIREEQLLKLKDRYYAVVVGSDQVWRLKAIKNFENAFFLNFVAPTTRKISYAASFGVDCWEDDVESDLTQKIASLVKNFTSVSVREEAGVGICRDVFGVVAKQVLDPTLLINRDFFEEIIASEKVAEEPSGVVYYKLDIEKEFLSLLQSYTAKNSLSLENIYYEEHKKGKASFITVPRWLWKIRNAKVVVTDSFHCTCFAIVFRKRFVYYPNQFRGMSRLESLLGLLGLTDRIYRGDIEEFRKIVETSIDYDSVYERIGDMKKLSMDFIKSSLA